VATAAEAEAVAAAAEAELWQVQYHFDGPLHFGVAVGAVEAAGTAVGAAGTAAAGGTAGDAAAGAAAGTAMAVAGAEQLQEDLYATVLPFRPHLHDMVLYESEELAGMVAAVEEADMYTRRQHFGPPFDSIAALEATERSIDSPMRRIMRLQVWFQRPRRHLLLATSYNAVHLK